MPNRLAGETSPYLLQHAHNPVDWFPWGGDALARAKLLDRPIFLSIGYAACHWCHVMERESFEDATTAAYMNDHFVAVKVDREERPDLDQLYMGAVQAMTGQGGWPMSVFLTPDGRPFYGGTYYPDEPRHGMPSFRQVLEGVERAWREQRDELESAGSRLVSTLVDRQRIEAGAAADDPTPGLLDEAAAGIYASFDRVNGGWGRAPKFPQPMTVEFLLRRMAGGDPEPDAVARFNLEKMADGGIHDQLGGGFHRYATDAIWLVPHFEQMLYDNAQLARVYLHAWAQTGDARFREVAEGVLAYLVRELTTADGAFAASQDADTDGVEGLTFTWTAAEVREVLGADAAPFLAAYGVTDLGNWEGTTILSRVWPDAHNPPPSRADAAFEAGLAASRARLLERRASRPQPARDDKALAAWNGLAIAAFADAGRLLGRADLTSVAVRAAEAITTGLLAADGSLGRSWKDGRATGQGVLEDYAHLADGLLALYEAAFDERWFTTARALMDRVLARFADPAGGFFDTADDHERLVARPKDVQDNAVPSGNAMATLVLLRLAAWTGEGRYRDAAERAMRTVTGFVGRYPTGFAQWLSAMDLALAPVVEVAIVGDPADPATQALIAETTRGFRPNQVVAVSADPATSVVPLLADRIAIDGKPTAYVCRGFVCRLPVTTPEALRAELAAASASGRERYGRPFSRRAFVSEPTEPRPTLVTEPVEPRPAATLVLLRPGRSGPEVLLGQRPPSMAFAPDVHVFPGGRVDSADAHPSLVARSAISPEQAAAALGGDVPPTRAISKYIAAIREAFEEAGVLLADTGDVSAATVRAARNALVGGEIHFQALAAQLDLHLRTDLLVSLSRWVTPPSMPRRFDARFFVAALPDGATASLYGDEVVEQAWLRPGDALEEMAEGRLQLWPPTAATLQQLEHATSFEQVRDRLSTGTLGSVHVESVALDTTRIEMPAAGGVAGQTVDAYLVGRRSFVLVDPGDPTGPALDRAVALASELGGAIHAIALTHVDADHSAGAEVLAERLGIPILVGPGGGRPLPYETRELADGERIDLGDVPLTVVATPGPRPEHVAFVVGDGTAVIAGDLDGRRGSRMLPGPVDDVSLRASRDRLARLAPGAPRLAGHRDDGAIIVAGGHDR